MKSVDDPETQEWLATDWDGTLQWDSGNTEKLAKHNASVEIIEEFFEGDFVFVGRLEETQNLVWKEKRYAVFGETLSGRLMTIVWTVRESSIRPISCRSMRPNEEREYNNRRRTKV